MNATSQFTLRQLLESLPLIFDSGASPELKACIQFNVSGAEPGVYCLRIDHDECTFSMGPCAQPTLTITTPSEIWLGIMRGEIPGQEAIMKGMYTISGDPSPLLKWSDLFKRENAESIRKPVAQRPAGPIPLSGGAWMTLGFVPWILHWITFGSFGLSPWISIGIPLLISALIVAYRLVYNRPGWLELGGVAFFALGGLLTILHVPAFAVWGSILSTVCMGFIWLASLFAKEPLSMQYIKWSFNRRLWGYSLFAHINAAISLVWGCQSLAAALFGAFGILNPSMRTAFTILRFGSMVPAYYFTSWYPKAGMQAPVKDTDKARKLIQFSSAGGVLLGICLLVFIAQFFR